MKSLDHRINKWISRKLLVFVVASVALFKGVLHSTDWVIIATAYIAVQSFVDSVEKLFKSKSNNGAE
jgi:hypothetical protein